MPRRTAEKCFTPGCQNEGKLMSVADQGGVAVRVCEEHLRVMVEIQGHTLRPVEVRWHHGRQEKAVKARKTKKAGQAPRLVFEKEEKRWW